MDASGVRGFQEIDSAELGSIDGGGFLTGLAAGFVIGMVFQLGVANGYDATRREIQGR